MRIISGLARGMRLASVSGQRTRPTSDRVKEALFNILGPAIIGSDFLDLYAGNGGIGLEALSRGAKSVIWIDQRADCVQMINANYQKSRLTGGTIYKNDVFRGLRQLVKKEKNFDFIFLDPPYEQGLLTDTLTALNEFALLKKEGIIIAEASKKEDAPQVMSKLFRTREERYGDTSLHFYQQKEALK